MKNRLRGGMLASLGGLVLFVGALMMPGDVFAGYTTSGCTVGTCSDDGQACGGTCTGSSGPACGCNDLPGSCVCNRPA